MTNQDKALSSDYFLNRASIVCAMMLGQAAEEDVKQVAEYLRDNFSESTSPQLPVAEQPAGQAMASLRDIQFDGPDDPHSPVAQMSGDALEQIDLKAQAGLCAGSFSGARAFLEDIREIVASHPSNAVPSDHLRDATKKVAATVPQVVQAPNGYTITRAYGHGWYVQTPSGEKWVAHEGTACADFLAALTAAAPHPVAAPIVPSDPNCAQAFNDAEDAMCPNCVTPWKCNGPHLAVQPEFDAFYEFFTKEAPKEPGIPGYDMCRHGWLAGIRYALLTTASNAGEAAQGKKS